jgi:hypothetical protein
VEKLPTGSRGPTPTAIKTPSALLAGSFSAINTEGNINKKIKMVFFICRVYYQSKNTKKHPVLKLF